MIFGERKREREERNIDVRNISQLPPIRAPTGNRTHDLWVYGMMLQPTEPPSQGLYALFIVI